jgi:hypothetical protein
MSEAKGSSVVTKLFELLDQEYMEHNPRDIKLVIEAAAREEGARRGAALTRFTDRRGQPVSSPFALLVDLVDSYMYCASYVRDFRHTFESYKSFMRSREGKGGWTPTEVSHARDLIMRMKAGIYEIYKRNCAASALPGGGLGAVPPSVLRHLGKIPLDPRDIDPRDPEVNLAITAAATAALSDVKRLKRVLDGWLGVREDLVELARAAKSRGGAR